MPAHASVFAQFTPLTPASDYKWIKNNTGGELISVTSNTDTTAHAVATSFSFIDSTYSALAFLPALFTIDATAAQGHPAIFNAGAGTYTQTGLTGAFHFTYNGAGPATYGAFTVLPGENLLSGFFTNASIQGAGGSGSTNVTIGNGGSAFYTSSVVNLAGVVVGSEEFAFNLLAVTPHFGANAGKALNSFRANGGGNFSAEGVPEPATWALMIMGFGGAGAMLRRRRVAVAVA